MNSEVLDPASVGQDRTFQDPEDALRRAQGTYVDRASQLSELERLPVGPSVGTNPFGTLSPQLGPGR